MEPRPISKHVYTLLFHPRTFAVNCTLVMEPDGITLVDTCVPGSENELLAAAEKLGQPVRRITVTHGHMDHMGAVEALARALPGVELALGEREARLMAGDFSLRPGETPGRRLNAIQRLNCQPQRLLKDGDRLGSLVVTDAPGHTPGSIAFYHPEDRVLISGDNIIGQGGVAVAGQIRSLFFFPSLATWDKAKALESARRMAALDPEWIVSGHGAAFRLPSARLEQALAAR